MGQAGLAQCGGRGQIGHQRGIAAAAALDDASAAGEDHGLGNAEALAHAVQALGLMAQRQAVEIGGGQPSLGHHVQQHGIQGGTPQAQARFQCPLHGHVEPRFDGALQELDGNEIDEQDRNDGHQHEGQRQPGHQPGSEQPLPEALHQPPGQFDGQHGQGHGHADVEPQ